MTTSRCKHGAHVLDDPPCAFCVAEVEIFRACAYTPKPEDPKNHLSGAAIERRMRGR